MTSENKILILGAGPTALASAVRLAQAGRKVKLIERLPWTGGLCQTYQRGAYALDLGPHRWTPHNKEVYDFVSDLLGGDLITVKYQAEIWIGDRFLSYPFRLGELLFKIPPKLSVKLVSTYLMSFLNSGKKGEVTYEEWVMNHFGREVTKLIFRPLIEKVWGTPLPKLASRFARQRIAIASLWEIAWEVLTGRRPKKFRSEFYPDNCFLYPPQGFGHIMNRMTEAFKKAGGEVVCGATVKEIRVEGGRVKGVSYEVNGRVETEEDPDFVISTIPIQYFFEILKPAPSSLVLETSKKLKTRKLVLLYLVLKMDRFSKNTSLYFPPGEFPFGRVWEQKNHSQKTVDVPGKTVLGLEMPCWESDELWTMDDKSVFEKAIAPLEKYGLLNRSDVEEFFTVKLGSVYPVWDVDFEKNLNTLIEVERGIENLIFNGRPGLFFYNNLHHSLDMGFVAARHLLSGKPKREKWEIDSLGFKEFALVE
jgi:protoporphyrinogen oxidase